MIVRLANRLVNRALLFSLEYLHNFYCARMSFVWRQWKLSPNEAHTKTIDFVNGKRTLAVRARTSTLNAQHTQHTHALLTIVVLRKDFALIV